MKPDTLVWAKDKAGNRHLCPMNILEDPNRVRNSELAKCIDRDDRLSSRRYVPSNDPQGKIKFARSISPN
jgi:hypothetical protein